MGGFSQLLRERGLERKVDVPIVAPTKPRAEGLAAYIVDNSSLRTSEAGLSFRRLPSLEELAKNLQLASFGSTVHGVPHVEGWIKVGDYFLPLEVMGHPVLLRAGWLDYEEPQPEPQETAVHVGRLPVPHLVKPEEGQVPPGREGAPYEVVYERMVVRRGPSLSAEAKGGAWRGDVVQLFAWDETRKWREGWLPTLGWGWMLLDHPQLGPLLRPFGLKFSVRPLEPICVAALEGDVTEVKHSIRRGTDVNVLHVDARTPLMLAAACGHLECCVALAGAGADVQEVLINFNGEGDGSRTHALLAAMAGQPFNSVAYQDALASLEAHVCADAEALVARGRRARIAGRKTHQMKAAEVSDGGTVEPLFAGQYEVVFPSVRIRRGPSRSAEPVGDSRRLKGETVSVLETETTDGVWGRIEHVSHEGRHSAWILLQHPELGSLLRPVVHIEEDNTVG